MRSGTCWIGTTPRYGARGAKVAFLGKRSNSTTPRDVKLRSRNVIPHGTAWSAIFAIVCGAVGVALIAMYI
jgi:hypothetical protein